METDERCVRGHCCVPMYAAFVGKRSGRIGSMLKALRMAIGFWGRG